MQVKECRKNDNLKSMRNFLNMTQIEFINEFLSDKMGERIMSVATFSNLENGCGKQIDFVIDRVSESLKIDKSVFRLKKSDFTNYLNNEFLDNELAEANKKVKTPNVNNLVNTLTQYFADKIISGQLQKGEQVESDRDLAKKLNTSRSAIREALKVLQIMGMIDIRPGQGTYISSQGSNFFAIPLSWALFLNSDQIENILVVRNSLEIKAVALASKSSNQDNIAKLTEVFNDSTKALQDRDLKRFIEEDIKFHLVIAECSENPLILALLSTIQNLLKKISSSGLIDLDQAEEVYKEHQDIYGAILLHDEKKAMAAMQEHSHGSYQRYKIH
ncbi:MAG: FadR/GntR family transcriptional regulator [Tissierellia bacterium]|nr:FadR/GntR family transcriptional regulator [Tissierellia bacterium]